MTDKDVVMYIQEHCIGRAAGRYSDQRQANQNYFHPSFED